MHLAAANQDSPANVYHNFDHGWIGFQHLRQLLRGCLLRKRIDHLIPQLARSFSYKGDC